jgi:multicomponent Na+:H+ antiporter subunit E
MSRFLFTFIILFLIWLGFTTSFATSELITGAVISLIITSFVYKTFTDYGMKFFNPMRIGYIVQYLFVFLIALIKANLDVAKRVINPKLPINPGIVKYETKLKSRTAKVILANSITLTPGTLTVDIIDDNLYIHWIDVTSKEPDVIYKEIGESFEKILRKIFQ